MEPKKEGEAEVEERLNVGHWWIWSVFSREAS